MPGFISETERLGGRKTHGSLIAHESSPKGQSIFSKTVVNNLNAKVQYQFDEKAHNSMRHAAKIAIKRENMDRIQAQAN